MEHSQTSGIFLVNKPRGLNSFRVVSLIRRKLNIKRVGHGGTLDPEATGLLIILVGKATKLFEKLLDGVKVYTGTICLGEQRDTQDVTGEVVNSAPLEQIKKILTPEKIEKIRTSFLGELIQIAPMYSAVKHKGKPLYKYARKGQSVEPKKRKVTIYNFTIQATGVAELSFEITTSKGTYIRSIADEFGLKLGVYGYLGSLKRTASGNFHLKDAIDFEWIKENTTEDLLKHMIKIEEINNENLS